MILTGHREFRLPINTESRENLRISHQITRCILPVMDILDLRFRRVCDGFIIKKLRQNHIENLGHL
jgi:hypothetical protein